MKKSLAPFIALVILMGCERENDIGLNAENISSIDVIQVGLNEQNQVRKISDRKIISQLVNCLNHADKELNKFYPSHKLIFHTKTGDVSVSISGNALRIDTGHRYVASCIIEQLLH